MISVDSVGVHRDQRRKQCQQSLASRTAMACQKRQDPHEFNAQSKGEAQASWGKPATADVNESHFGCVRAIPLEAEKMKEEEDTEETCQRSWPEDEARRTGKKEQTT